MAVVQSCKCDECGIQKSFVNHWVMLIRREEELVILPAWNEERIHETLHFCGRAHAGRYIERWMEDHTAAPHEPHMAAPGMPGLLASGSGSRFPQGAEDWLEDEESAESARASVRFA